MTVQTTTIPHESPADRVVFDHLGDDHDGYSHITLRFGFQDRPDVPAALALARRTPPGLAVDFTPYHATYVLSQVTIVADRSPGMARWREALLLVMARNAASPAHYFHLPAERVVALGSQIRF